MILMLLHKWNPTHIDFLKELDSCKRIKKLYKFYKIKTQKKFQKIPTR